MASSHAGYGVPDSSRPLQPRSARAPLTIPVHTAVKGRLRIHVPYLMNSAEAKYFIERELSLSSSIKQVRANPVTGNVLVLFDPIIESRQIGKRIERIVRNFKANG